MAQRSGIGQHELRRVNLSALLSRVHVSGPTTRAALTTELGLNRSTIGDLTAYLEQAGLVRSELPSRPRGTGRPSHVVVPNEGVTVLTVAIDVDRIDAAVIGLGGVVLARRERQHAHGGHSVSAVVESVAAMCDDLLGLELGRCLAIGVSVPGVIQTGDGLVRFAPNLGWVDEPFTAMLAERFDLPITTGNDADLGTLAEHLRGAAMGFEDVAFISGGVGIGAGFISGGIPLQGWGGFGGEVGHFPVDVVMGAQCRCGARGCWETKIGEDHLLEAAGLLPGGGPKAVAEVIGAADAGQPRAVEAVDSCAFWTGVGLGAIINVLNPAIVVVGGLLAAIWVARPETVSGSIDAVALTASRSQVTIRSAGLGGDSALIGAAELAFAPLLADPMAF